MGHKKHIWFGVRTDFSQVRNKNYSSLTRQLRFRVPVWFKAGSEVVTRTGHTFWVYRDAAQAHRAIRELCQKYGLTLNERLPNQKYDPNWRMKLAAAKRRGDKLNGKV